MAREMAKAKMPKDNISLKTLDKVNKKIDEEIELIPDVEMLEELSEEAKVKRQKAISVMREKAMATIDAQKLPNALKTISALGYSTDILSDPEVWERVKTNIKSPMDLKFLTEAQKLSLQNIDAMLRMGSVNTQGDAGEFFVSLQFGNKDNMTQVAIQKK